MKKWLLSLLVVTLGLSLFACNGEEEEVVTPPSLDRIEIQGRSPEADGELDPYTVEKGETIRAEIFLDNPSNVELNLVRMHDRNFRAARFEEESTREHIIIEFSASSIPGETLHTLEHIEYLDDGVETLDFEEEPAYIINVLEEAPSVTLTSVTPDVDAIDFTVSIDDTDDVLETGRIELLHEDDIEAEMSLAAGEAQFDSLLSDHAYTLRIFGDYELNDGEGMREDVLLFESDTVETLEQEAPTASFEAITVTENSAAFSVDFVDAFDVKVENSLRIELFEEEAESPVETLTLDPEALEDLAFDELLYETDYSLRLFIDYDLQDGEPPREDKLLAQASFVTEAKDIPAIDTTLQTITEDRVVFTIDASALEGIVTPGTLVASFYDDETDERLATSAFRKESGPIEVDTFTADTPVRMEIEGEFDPEDGGGERFGILHEEIFRTTANAAPDASVSAVETTQTTVSFNVTTTDTDQTFIEDGLTAHLYAYDGEENEHIDSKSIPAGGGSFVFEDLTVYADYSYSVLLEGAYDLRDGEGVRTWEADEVFVRARTSPKAPEGAILEIEEEKEALVVGYKVHDNDATLLEDGITISIGDASESFDALEGTARFEGLKSDSDYTASLDVAYDLGDGLIEETLSLEDAQTLPMETPSISFESLVSDQETIDYALEIEDEDATGTLEAVRLFKDDSLIAEEQDVSGTFAGLYSDTAYTIEATYAYDLNDGEGERTLTVEEILTTEAKAAPELVFTDVEAAQESVTFDLDITDGDDVGGISAIELYQDGAKDDELADFDDLVFEDLLSDTAYTIEATYAYDLNDGEGERTLTVEESLTTEAKAAPEGTLEIESLDLGEVAFALSFTDEDDTITEDVTLELIKDEQAVDDQTFSEDDTGVFTELESDTAYTLSLVAKVDMNDGEALQEVVLSSMSFQSVDADPDVAFTDVATTPYRIDTIVSFDDQEGAVDADSLRFALYDEAGDLVGERSLEDSMHARLTALYSDHDYTARIYGDIDREDGEGLIEDALLHEGTLSTDALTLPIPEFLGWTAEGGDITIELGDIDDSENVYFEDDMRLVIYDITDGEQEVASVDLNIDETGGEYTFDDVHDENREYRVTIEASYDLNTYEGPLYDQILDSFTFFTIN